MLDRFLKVIVSTQKGFNYIFKVKRKLCTLCNVETNNWITYFSKHTFAIFFSEYPHRVHRVMRHGNLYLAVLKNIHYLYNKKQFRKKFVTRKLKKFDTNVVKKETKKC
jgi:predicted patatin/cPLA2 family phospholipase